MIYTCGDVLRAKRGEGSSYRFGVWKVVGVHLGGLNQESVVEIITLDEALPNAKGEIQRSCLVPECILDLAMLERV